MKRSVLAALMLSTPLTALAQNATVGVPAVLNGNPVTILAPYTPNGDGTYSPQITVQGLASGVALPVNCTTGCSGGGGTSGGTSTAAAPTYTEGATGQPLSMNLTGDLRVISKQSGAWNVGISGTLPAFASTPTVNIGTAPSLTIGTLPALAAGSNAIGSITNTGFAATQSGSWSVGGLTGVAQSASVTRPANTTAYAAGQAICASTSANCTPMQITVAGANGATGTFGRVWLLKSGSSTTNATFALYLYSTSPTVASVHDASSYVGPFAADLPGYLGSWNCITANLTSDATAQVYYECVPTAAQGWNQYQAATGVKYVYGMLAATAAYTPASGEVFTAYVNSLQDK